MKAMPDNSVDSVVTDPPYELGFMGKSWDASGIAFNVDVWREALRVLKPGGHLIAFSGSRTYHRMAVAIEDAGFEIRDQIMWLYGSGFPKSMNIGKTLDDWQGWGTALKPAHEPMVLARKPLIGTVAANVLAHGTGGLNIDASRVSSDDALVRPEIHRHDNGIFGLGLGAGTQTEPGGRWPANLIHDGLETEWAKFFYCAKASKKDRNEGLEDFEDKRPPYESYRENLDAKGGDTPFAGAGRSGNELKNFHPTVKPTNLMRYLVKLVTPPTGTVLDPFMGSGSTGKACVLEGFQFIGIDQSPEYVEIAKARIKYATTSIF